MTSEKPFGWDDNMPEETAGDYNNQKGKTSSVVMLNVYGFVSLASAQCTAVM